MGKDRLGRFVWTFLISVIYLGPMAVGWKYDGYVVNINSDSVGLVICLGVLYFFTIRIGWIATADYSSRSKNRKPAA